MWKKKIINSALIFLSATTGLVAPPVEAQSLGSTSSTALPLELKASAQHVEVPSAESFLIDEAVNAQAKHPKIALVLGGGGLRGAAHVGILRVLEREGIPIDLVVGTSMGAVVGGLYCAGVSTDKLERELVRNFISSYYTAPLTVQALKVNASFLMLRKPQGLYDGENLAHCIDNYVALPQREIRNLRPQFAAVTTDLVEGRTRLLTEGNLGKALQASTAIPLLRKPVAMGDALLVDGGAICNLPVDQAKALGADFIIAVDVNEKIESTDKKRLRHHMVKTSSRVVSLMLAKIDEGQKQAADICIQPDVTGISLLSRKSSEGERALAAGEDAAMKAMPELKSKLAKAGIDLSTGETLISDWTDSVKQDRPSTLALF